MIIRTEHDWPLLDRFLHQLKQQPLPKGGMEFIWRKPRRTNKQNRYLWGVVYKTLAEGMTEQSSQLVKPKWVHELCKQYFAPRIGVPGTDKTIPMSTTELCRSGNEESFQDYVMQIQKLAVAKGIYIPDPNEGANEEA